MGIGSFIKKQFIDVLQWNEDSDGVLAWRYPMADQEIQNGGQLVVRESQVAVFVNEGQVADVFGPGTHTLTTQTLPVLTNLKNWDKLFASPFKSDVYFFSTRVQTGRKWGTAQPITIRDKDFDMVRVRAFGMYSYRVINARAFFSEISGTREVYTRDEVEDQLRGILMATMAGSLGASQVPFLDMAANQALMAQQVKGDLTAAFARYGIGLDEFNVASVSLPEELQAALDERISAGMKGGMSADKMAGFTKYQVASAIPLAAQNEGGLAGIGAGLGAGLTVGQAIGQSMGAALAPQAAPAAAAPAEDSVEARLEKLKGLLDKGLISAADYDSAKAELLKKLIG
ncbi:Membrane protease subunit, stomatin/prohibitin family, contains C-terminal Zn-ribbon domain [Duganella sp. CF402]|uniref:SPFH domain-containing protein n=1 Tax=unclassified Duganella TaxID=2636909 RepID=UPI0008BD44AB|nr:MULTISPECIES: SPFH domain-containing protein [unclassified Duganella]RZT05663.1 membrane protease subunit (stomatin/prohibitin family) [Duganella sp. BK701]SEM95557.1 Membrane protease subunit, stomatin/prohibitin family, contains C-terminal Zn-ribbon domain [Duganella sp. CF402]